MDHNISYAAYRTFWNERADIPCLTVSDFSKSQITHYITLTECDVIFNWTGEDKKLHDFCESRNIQILEAAHIREVRRTGRFYMYYMWYRFKNINDAMLFKMVVNDI